MENDSWIIANPHSLRSSKNVISHPLALLIIYHFKNSLINLAEGMVHPRTSAIWVCSRVISLLSAAKAATRYVFAAWLLEVIGQWLPRRPSKSSSLGQSHSNEKRKDATWCTAAISASEQVCHCHLKCQFVFALCVSSRVTFWLSRPCLSNVTWTDSFILIITFFY